MTAKQRLPKIALVFFMAGLLFLFGSNLTWATFLQVEAYIDGRSLLIIQGNTVQWDHRDFTVPGKHDGHNDPTKMATSDASGPIWSYDWYPTWSLPIDQPQKSDIFTGLLPPLAAIEQTVTVMSSSARNFLGIDQQPLAANNYTLIIDFNDNPVGGSTWYGVTLEYVAAAAATPLPGAIWLLGSGLLGLAGLGRFSKK